MENGYLIITKHVCKTISRRILLIKIQFSEGITSQIQEIFLCLYISLLKCVSFMR
jgi:hypothetical protein